MICTYGKLLADIKFNKQGYIEKINGDLSEEGKSYTVIATFSYNKAGQPVAASHNYTKKGQRGRDKEKLGMLLHVGKQQPEDSQIHNTTDNKRGISI